MPKEKNDNFPKHFLNEKTDYAEDIEMRCGGCGAKVAADILDSVLSDLATTSRSDLPMGLAERGDVAIMDCGGGFLAQSVDQVREFVSDPWLFARIATLHALSDLYAARCRPQSAMVLVTLPWGAESVVRSELEQLMQGVVLELNQAGCALSGGHTAEGRELSLGFVVNGIPPTGEPTDKSGPWAGDHLILTKPLGTGVILAADMRALASGPVVDGAIRSMLVSNAAASAVLDAHGARAITDVTGFGLLGHLIELLRPTELGCTIDSRKVPVLPGAVALSRAGIRSSLFPANARLVHSGNVGANLSSLTNGELMADPQTSGGLLAAVPEDIVETCLTALWQAGAGEAAVIGRVVEGAPDEPKVFFRQGALDR